MNQPYKRFDYKTPGAAQKASGFTEGQYQGRAMGVLGYKSPVMPDISKTGYKSPIAVALANKGVDPKLQQEIGRYGVSKGLEKNNLDAQNFMKAQGITDKSTPQEVGRALDAYQRSQQAKNQRPKRGLLSSLPFQLATAALGGMFFGPAISAGLKGLGAAGTAIKGIGAINTGVNIGRAA